MEIERIGEANEFGGVASGNESTFSPNLIGTVHRTNAAFARSCGAPGVTVEVDTGVRYTFGGKEDAKGSFYFNGTAQDSNGGRVKLEAERKSDGTTDIFVGGGYKGKVGGNKNKRDHE